MARALTVKVTGIKTTQKRFKRLVDAVQSETAREMDTLVKDIEGDAKRIAAKKKGFHQRSINSEVEVGTRSGVIGIVGANQKYSKRLEDPDAGLKHRSRQGFIGKPTPSLLPALAKNHVRIVKGISRGVKRAIKKVGK